jgi:hypothetical protein
MHRLQTQKLLDDKEQEEAIRPRRAQEVLPVLQQAYGSQGDPVIRGLRGNPGRVGSADTGLIASRPSLPAKPAPRTLTFRIAAGQQVRVCGKGGFSRSPGGAGTVGQPRENNATRFLRE